VARNDRHADAMRLGAERLERDPAWRDLVTRWEHCNSSAYVAPTTFRVVCICCLYGS
jgi:hypothetical protein